MLNNHCLNEEHYDYDGFKVYELYIVALWILTREWVLYTQFADEIKKFQHWPVFFNENKKKREKSNKKGITQQTSI